MKPRLVVRPDATGRPDDIVVEGVTMFRAEAMDKDHWWVACYFTNGERIAWWVRGKKGIRWTVSEMPTDYKDWGDAKPPINDEDGGHRAD